MEITQPSIKRLARQAGVKNISEDCYDKIRALAVSRLETLIENALVINSQHQTKTLMTDDIYIALNMMGENYAKSTELSTMTVGKMK